jgi:DNA-binding CsgD family transcriptional regulator
LTIRSSESMLVGRDRELAAVTGFLSRAAVEGGALRVHGEPGMGKTAVLDAAARHAAADGTRVVRAEGVEFEASTLCSGLNQVLLPLSGGLALLPPAHREALAVVLGLDGGDLADRSRVAHAALTLIRAAGADRPLLLVVDDLQWLDRYSADVLEYVARRLAGSRAGFLGATRSGPPGAFEPAGLPRLDLGPLPEAAADALLRSRFPALPPRVRGRLLAEAAGNPLALLELPAALSSGRHDSWQSLPAVLPLSARLQAMFAERVTVLPAETRELLLLTVLAGAGDVAVLDRASGGRLLTDLAPAERAGLVWAEDHTRQIVFRHSLTRSAVVGLSTAAERRQAHRRLADALADRPDRRAWHLAEAALGPDEEVAGLLADSAHRIVIRGDPFNAAAALIRAAELSPDPESRGRRLAEAAWIGGTMTWQMGDLPALLARARQDPLDAGAELHAAAAAAYLMLNGDDDIEAAHRVLLAAIEANAGSYDAADRPLIAAIDTLFQTCLWSGRAELWESYLTVLRRLRPNIPRANFVLTYAFADPVRVTPAVLAELDAAITGLRVATDPDELGKITSAAVYVDRLAACREALRRQLRGEQVGGAMLQAIGARLQLIVDAWFSGRWDEDDQLRQDGLDACEATGNRIFPQAFHYHGGLLAAATGDHERAAAQAARLIGWGAPRGSGLAQVWATHVRMLDAAARGDHQTAYQQGCLISPPGTFPPYVPTALWICLDLVEAAVRTGRIDEAGAHVAAMRAAGLPAVSARLDFLTRAGAAVAAPDAEAGPLYEDALGMAGTLRWPFDVARVQLLHGERLRRTRAPAAARAPLTAAVATFERLGAAPWTARAHGELRAAGGGPGRTQDEMTPQEYEIASLAAVGLTNKQIGERLFLSHRTVSTHLYRVFPKLGVTSRAALGDALARIPPLDR